MTKLSSGFTGFNKKIFPALWFGFLAFFLVTSALAGALEQELSFLVVPILMAVFGYFLMKKLVWDLVDEVYDCGDFLLVKNRDDEERIALSNIMNVNASTYINPPRITLRLVNPSKFGSEVALFRTSEGGMSRMAVSWDSPGSGGEMGRVRGQTGSFYGKYEGLAKTLPDLKRPPLPPGVASGGHGGSHGYLMNEFVTAVITDRKPLVHVGVALNMTVAGIVAHESAVKGGELMKIPQFHLD